MSIVELLNIQITGKPEKGTIIFLHGFPFDQSMWKHQIEYFKNDYRCVHYDIRGLGKSSISDGQFTMEMFVDDCFAIMNELHIVMPIICGISMGGYLTFRAIERMQQAFSGAILFDTRAEADGNAAKLKRAAGIKLINEEGLENFIDGFVAGCFSENYKQKYQTEYERIKERSKLSHPVGVKGCLLAMQGRTDVSASLGEIKIPTLFLCGELDPLTPPKEMREVSTKIEGSVFEIIPGAGHISPLENPKFVNGAMKKFLDGFC